MDVISAGIVIADCVARPVGRPPPLSDETVSCPFFERCDRRMPGVCDVCALETCTVGEAHTVRCFLYDPGPNPALKTQTEVSRVPTLPS